MARHFYLFYGDAPRLQRESGESAESWIARERQQKEFIGQRLEPHEERLLRELVRREDSKD